MTRRKRLCLLLAVLTLLLALSACGAQSKLAGDHGHGTDAGSHAAGYDLAPG